MTHGAHGREAIVVPGIEEEEEEDELDMVPSSGPPWWHRFPDFVPVSALKWGTNPRSATLGHMLTSTPAAMWICLTSTICLFPAPINSLRTSLPGEL